MSKFLVYLLVIFGLTNSIASFAETAQVKFNEVASSVPDSEESKVKELPADTSEQLHKQFKRDNPDYREHVFHQITDVYEDNDANPGVRLERVWVGAKGTLVELTGLPRKGQLYSAIINKATLRMVQPESSAALVQAEGVAEMQDSRGGTALMLKAGDTLYLLFGAIDDIQPFSIEHRLPDGQRFAYFENLDPRFLDRYHRDFLDANTPEKRYQFLMNYVSHDPENKVAGVFSSLMQDFRSLNSFEGYYRAYLIAQMPSDARMAQKLATKDEHRAKLEHLAVVTLVDKSRLFDFDLRLENNTTNQHEGSCWMFCLYNFTARRPLTGTLSMKLRRDAPIKLRYGHYRVTFAGQVHLPRHQQRKSGIRGDYDGSDNQSYPISTSVDIAAGSSAAAQNINLGMLEMVEFERGSVGGFHAIWANGNPTVNLHIQSVELIQ